MANLTGRSIAPKEVGRKNQKLRDSAKKAPHCFSCFTPNLDGQNLCMAHSNKISAGKGRGLKAMDSESAILCMPCHDICDGRTGKLSRAEMQEKHDDAHLRTVEWWKSEGYLS